jgi:hypothetical protein
MEFVRCSADNRDNASLAAKLRIRRFTFFKELLQAVPRPIRILDIGGTQVFWEVMDFTDEPGIHIVILGLAVPQTTYENFTGVAGDATNLTQFADNEFDVVFSNSVIEHVGDYDKQSQMAQEVRRVGRRYFVQTPNFFFPIEPHFLFPAYHWLPMSMRVWLLRHFDLGWGERTDDIDRAREQIEGIRLLRRREIVELFPGSKLYEERVLGLVKSFVIYGDWQWGVAADVASQLGIGGRFAHGDVVIGAGLAWPGSAAHANR